MLFSVAKFLANIPSPELSILHHLIVFILEFLCGLCSKVDMVGHDQTDSDRFGGGVCGH